MKTKKPGSTIAIFTILFLMISNTTFSTIINISASNFIFSPSNVNASVGDTIKWTWTNGNHTTTCDGSNGTSRPAGAASWDADLDAGNPTFTYKITIAGTYNYVCVPHSPEMSGIIQVSPSSVTQLTELVNGYELSQNYPNPFNPVTNINFSIPASSNVILKVYNGTGQEVETLVNGKLNAGAYRVDWNASNFTSGIYFYKIQANDFAVTRKMLLVK